PPIFDETVKGVIFSGSPFSVNDSNPLIPDVDSIKSKMPLLVVCYGAQFLAKNFGGRVEASKTREYGRANLSMITSNKLMKGVNIGSQVWMSHGDTIHQLPNKAELICSSGDIEIAGFQFIGEETY